MFILYRPGRKNSGNSKRIQNNTLESRGEGRGVGGRERLTNDVIKLKTHKWLVYMRMRGYPIRRGSGIERAKNKNKIK